MTYLERLIDDINADYRDFTLEETIEYFDEMEKDYINELFKECISDMNHGETGVCFGEDQLRDILLIQGKSNCEVEMPEKGIFFIKFKENL